MPQLAPAPLKRRKRNPSPTVVLADGDEVALDTTRRFLLLHGYEVETATGGVQCLDKLRRLSDPVLVLDFELPWGGGDGVLALLREDSTLADAPVILTMRPASMDRVKRLVRDAVQRVLFKPVVPKILLDVVRDLRPTPGSGVTLCGRVTHCYLRELARAAVLITPGVRGLRDELAVRPA
jgi:CheY-like chemotaxis protein